MAKRQTLSTAPKGTMSEVETPVVPSVGAESVIPVALVEAAGLTAPVPGATREALIREAAYRRFEARGGAPGNEAQDWLDAEAEVDGRIGAVD